MNVSECDAELKCFPFSISDIILFYEMIPN